MADWEVRALGDCIKLISGSTPSKRTPEFWGGEIPWVSPKDLVSPRIWDTQDHLTEAGAEASTLVSPETILIPVRGMGLAKAFPVAITKRRMAFNQDIKAVASEKFIDSKFLFYWFVAHSYEIMGLVDEAAHGTKRIQTDRLLSHRISIPPLETQRKIAHVVSAYDDLIDNNLSCVKVLEEIARTIFSEWFGKFRFPGHEFTKFAGTGVGRAPNDWSIGTFGDLVENVRLSVRPDGLKESWHYVPMECIPQRSLALLDSRPISEAKSSLTRFEKDDILFGAMRAYFHRVCSPPFAGVTRTTCLVLRPSLPEDWAFVIMTIFQDSAVEYASVHSLGSTMPYTPWQSGLAQMPMAIPPSSLRREFGLLVSPMLRRIQRAYYLHKCLEVSRELLLPGLISGQLDISHVDVKVGNDNV